MGSSRRNLSDDCWKNGVEISLAPAEYGSAPEVRRCRSQPSVVRRSGGVRVGAVDDRARAGGVRHAAAAAWWTNPRRWCPMFASPWSTSRRACSDRRSRGRAGTFVVSLLPPGRYRLTAQRDGFVTTEIPDIVLNVGDVVDVTLLLQGGRRRRVGHGVGGSVAREHVARGRHRRRSAVRREPAAQRPQLPVADRDDARRRADARQLEQPGQFSVNGQRSDANYFMVDGVSANVGVQPTAGLGPRRRRRGARRSAPGRHQQPGLGRRAAGVPDPDVDLRAGVRPHAGRRRSRS